MGLSFTLNGEPNRIFFDWINWIDSQNGGGREPIQSQTLTDEIVILSGSEFKPTGLRREWTEGDGEVHELVRLVADGNDPRVWIGNAARVVLFLRHVVNDVLFSIVFVRAGRVNRANNVDLIVFKWNVVLVDVNNVICVVYPKSGEIEKE